MLSPELQICTAHFQIETNSRTGRTCPTVVNRPSSGEEDNLLSRLMKSVAPVNIFSVHEELRIQQSDPLNRLAPRHHEPAVQHFDWPSRLVIEIGHQETAEKSRLREQDIEPNSSA